MRARLIPSLHKPLPATRYQRQTTTKLIESGFLLAALLVAHVCTGAGLREYTAQEAREHIGERATVVGKVDCIGHGRRHVDLQIGGCDLRKALLWIVVPQEASGPELDPETVRGVQIAITGKIESAGGTPQITIKSTTQIQPRTALQINYIGRAYEKERQGDFFGAMGDLDKAIAHQPARRDEACEHLARLKEQRGDWAGALAAYDRLVALDPNKSGSYYVRATAKKQHGDFEAAMTDYGKAAELRSSPSDYIQMGNWRQEKDDITGAAAEYDKAIALCDRAITGTTKTDPRSPLGSDPYFSRGCARELKGDLNGAVADYTQAIANNPTQAAMAYGARGNIRGARGDLSGAIADYQHKYQITHYPDDKQKLEQVRAEAKAGAKKVVVTQPSIRTAQNEHSYDKNKDEGSPESIAEAFVQAYSGTDVDAVADLYADRVDHTDSGVINNAAMRAQAKEYFARWPVRQWSLVGPVKTIPLGASRQKVMFSANYYASNPQTNKHASGLAQETLILATDASAAMKIVSQKEQTSKKSSSQSDEERSGDLDLQAVKPEASTAKDVSIMPVPSRSEGGETGNVKVTFSDGHTEMLTHTGDCYKAKVSAKGKIGWIRIGKAESSFGRTMKVGKDSLVVRLPDATTKKFPPFEENVCIMDWRFTDDDKTLIVRSMGYHGPSSYVQYDLATGKVIDSRGPNYTPYAKLPTWAKPLAYPDE
jgi:tetratricopeptide (TPR) repeat protein